MSCFLDRLDLTYTFQHVMSCLTVMGPPMGVNAGILYTMQCTQLYAATGHANAICSIRIDSGRDCL